MEFEDRNATNPGRVKLTPVTGQPNVYDLTMADGAAAGSEGTPLNKSKFNQIETDILSSIATNPDLKGPKGDKGDKGDTGDPRQTKTFLVGTNTAGMQGWYKLGSFTVGQYWDYHAKFLITNTFGHPPAPTGEINIDARMGTSTWDQLDIKWSVFRGQHPECIKYYASTTGTVTLYAYVPQQYAFYRVDILAESNRDVFTNLFVPATAYGGVHTTRYSASEPNGTVVPVNNWACNYLTVNYFSGTATMYGKAYNSSATAQWWYTIMGGRIFNYIKLDLSISGDHWIRIPLGSAVGINCLPFRDTTSGYTPGFICWVDGSYTYIGLDENNMQGAYITIIQ